jgi:arabinoxylan arabinofuranohydrolase
MKKKTSMIFLMLLVVTLIICTFPISNVMAVNPYLPLWEHLPDGEPRVFEDPDNPGHYRAYIFGSHDVRYTSYCADDIRAWSAPVEDLTNWRDEGSVIKYYISGQWDVFYAPDIAEIKRKDGAKDYYLYPHSRGSGRIGMVAKGNRPTGPFTPINMTADGTGTLSGSVLGFDPAVWVEYVTDPNDPDYNIGFRAYAYWGYAGDSNKTWACQLDQNTMYSVRPGTQAIHYFIPCSSSYGVLNDPAGTTYPCIYPGEDLTKFNFFEASSIRKVGNKYIMLYSGYSGPDYGLSSTNSALRYCYGDTPLGPWKIGGVLVDSRAVVLNDTGTALTTTYSGHNTHGSLMEINGHWYCYYHRAPRGYGYARQPMVAPVKITWDQASVADGGKAVIRAFDPYAADNTWTAKDSQGREYTGAEVTSEGFEVFGLDPYKYYSAGYACYLSSTGTQQDTWDIWDNNMPITSVANGHRIGYKYFGFGGLGADQASQYGLKAFAGTKPGNNTKFNLFLTPKTTNAFKINIWMDGPLANDTWKGTKIGEINVPANSEQVTTKFSVDVSQFVDNAAKKHAIFLVAEGTGTAALFDLIGLGFSSDTKQIAPPTVPTLSIFVNGAPLTLPTTPVRSTNANGICDYDLYEVSYALPASLTTPVVTASSSDPNVKITITQPPSPSGVAVVRFNKDGVEKTYRIDLSTNENPSYSADTWNVVTPKDPENPKADITFSGNTVTIQSKLNESTSYRYPQCSNILQLPDSIQGDWTATVAMTLSQNLNNTATSVAIATNAGFGLRDPEKGTVEATAEYCSVNAEKMNTTLAGAGSRSYGRVNGVQSSTSSNSSYYLSTGTTYSVRLVKSGNTVAASYLRSNGSWTSLRSYTFNEDFFKNAKFELFVQNPSDTTPISAQFTVTVVRQDLYTNRSPVMDTLPNYIVDAGKLLSFNVGATDPDGDILTCSALNLPKGAIFNPFTRKFSWTPSKSQTGTYSVQFTANDRFLSDSKASTIMVNYVNQAPVMTVSNYSATAGQTLSFTISATDADGDALSYSAPNLPAGASFDPATKLFSWIPDTAGTYTPQFTVSDGQATASATTTIIVYPSSNRPPVMSAIPSYIVKTGKLVSFTIKASDPDSSDVLTYSAVNLPAGATFNTSTKKFSYTPTIAGIYTVQFTVSDGWLSDSKTATIIVQ